MGLHRLFTMSVPVVVLGSIVLTVAVGPQWAPPVGVGVLAGGDSMAPALCPGDVVVYADGTAIERGDLIMFRTEQVSNPIVTHRVIASTPRGYITKGDNRRVPDDRLIGPVNDTDVIGEVIVVTSIRNCTPTDTQQSQTDRRAARLADASLSAGHANMEASASRLT